MEKIINEIQFTPQIVRAKRRSIFDPDNELPPPTPIDCNPHESYKVRLQNEVKEWTRILQKKYLSSKQPTAPQPLKPAASTEEVNVNLTDEQEIYLSQAPDFHRMVAERKAFVESIEYYLNLRSHVVENIEYKQKLITDIANKAVRDIINKAIYE